MEIPKEIGLLERLRVLLLHSNKLTELPTEIISLSKLAYIRLEKNHLKELTYEIRLWLNSLNIRY